MTRIEAIKAAIEIVGDADIAEGFKREVQEGLRNALGKQERTNWTEERIWAVARETYEAQGFLTPKDFTAQDMPSQYIVYNRFKMYLKEFIDTYFPPKEPMPQIAGYARKTISEWNALFIDEYKRISPSSAHDYTRRRNRELPPAKSVQQMNGGVSWDGLLSSLGLESQGGRQGTKTIIYQVSTNQGRTYDITVKKSFRSEAVE